MTSAPGQNGTVIADLDATKLCNISAPISSKPSRGYFAPMRPGPTSAVRRRRSNSNSATLGTVQVGTIKGRT